MTEVSIVPATKRYAVVTGSNKRIGFEICRQLASNGYMVVLTARDEKKGHEAVEKLIKESGQSDYLVFHQLDVVDPASVASLAEFIKSKFGKLDILVNNAIISGLILDPDALARAVALAGGWLREREGWRCEILGCLFVVSRGHKPRLP